MWDAVGKELTKDVEGVRKRSTQNIMSKNPSASRAESKARFFRRSKRRSSRHGVRRIIERVTAS